MRREPGEPLNPSRLSAADIEALKARIAPHVFASQYQQRPEAGGELVELPDLLEAIISHDSLDKPAIIVMDGNGVGRGPYQDLWARGFRHLLPGESMAGSASDNLKIRRFSEGLFSLYDGLVRLPNAMPGRALETLLAEIAAFPDGKHDDPGRCPELRRSLSCEGDPRGPSLGPQARAVEAAAGQGPDRPAQVARSGALRPATTASGLTGCHQSDAHGQLPLPLRDTRVSSTPPVHSIFHPVNREPPGVRDHPV